MALASKLKGYSHGKAVQLMMEYDPQPPFKSGNPKAADADSVTMLRAMAITLHRDLDAFVERLAK